MDSNWDDLRTILAVVRGGTLAAAGKSLGLNYTSVARRISRAEADLGMSLFEKGADGYKPTQAARIIADNAAKMEEHSHALMRDLMGQPDALSGPLIVTAPQLLIAYILAPVLDSFARAHPDVDLQVRSSNELLDLNKREADLAIRISNNPGDTLTGLRLAEQDTASFTSPEYAARIAADPGAEIDWVVYAQYPDVPQGISPRFPNNRVRLRLDDMGSMLGAAQAGIGVVRMPMFLGRTAPGVVQVPVLEPKSYLDIWVVAHKDVWGGARPAAFRDHLVPYMRKQRALFLAHSV